MIARNLISNISRERRASGLSKYQIGWGGYTENAKEASSVHTVSFFLHLSLYAYSPQTLLRKFILEICLMAYKKKILPLQQFSFMT